MTEKGFDIEVVGGLPDQQRLIDLQVPPGTTVAAAVSASKILRFLPELDVPDVAFGIWGKRVAGDQLVSAGDRVELYRPLKIEPREARRQLATLGKTMSGGLSD